ncbi:MAG: ABC transporter ATP-binding protein [Anaerolineales bacterium]
MIALKARSMVKTYSVGDGEVRAVDDVSFCIQKGELVALVGPSGSGKTTAVAMLAGLLQPTSGSILVGGEELTAMKEAEKARFRRRNIGFTFQQNNLVSYLTALENVELILRLNGEFDATGRGRARELLILLGLEERLDALPRQLSGGQQQRVSIARSLINRPNLVLADEPTASLDTERAIQVVETLADLVHEQERAGIMVTHDLRLVEYVDRIIQMVDGRVARIVDPQDDLSCLADPASCEKITAEALGCSCGEKRQMAGALDDNP